MEEAQEQRQEAQEQGTASPPQRLELADDIFVGFDKLAEAYGVVFAERAAAKAMIFYADQDRPMLVTKVVAVCLDGAVVLPEVEASFYVEPPDIADLDGWPAFPRTWKVCGGELLSKVPGAADGLYLAGWQALNGGLVLQLGSSAEAALRVQQQDPGMCARPESGARRLVTHNHGHEIVVPLAAAVQVVHAARGPSSAELKEQHGPAGTGIDWARRSRRWYGERLRVEELNREGVVLTVAALREGSLLREYQSMYMGFNEDLQEWTIDRLDGLTDKALEAAVTCAVGVDSAQAPPHITLSLDFHCDAALLPRAGDGAAAMTEEAHQDGEGGGGSGSGAAAIKLDLAAGLHQFKRVVPQGVTCVVLGVADGPRDACLQLVPKDAVVAWRLEQADRLVRTDLANVRHAQLAVTAPVEAGGPLPIAYAKRQVQVSQAYFKLAPVPAADTEEAKKARQAALGGYVPPAQPVAAALLGSEDLSTVKAELGLIRQQEHGRNGEATDRVRPVLRVRCRVTGCFSTCDLMDLLKDRPELAPVLGMRCLVDVAGAAPVEGQEDAMTLVRVAVADLLSPSCFGATTKADLLDAGWGTCAAAFNRFVQALMGARIHVATPDKRGGGKQRAGGSRGLKAPKVDG